jgi:hypothetical protein
MDRFVKIRSWHLLRTYTRSGGGITRCGKSILAPLTTSATLDLNDKSCESCLRYMIAGEAPAVEDDPVPG